MVGKKQVVAAAEPFEDSAASTVATYVCPVCRKAHVLDLDRLQVTFHKFCHTLPCSSTERTSGNMGVCC